MKFKINGILAIVIALLLAGCSAPALKGPNFTLDKTSVANKSKIYFYWNKVNDTATRQDFIIEINNKPVRTIKQGGYFVYNVSPGENHIETQANFTFGMMGMLDLAFVSNEKLTIYALTGKTYFVRCTLAGYKGRYRLPMTTVTADTGLRDIQTTKLLPDDHKQLVEVYDN